MKEFYYQWKMYTWIERLDWFLHSIKMPSKRVCDAVDAQYSDCLCNYWD